MQIRSARPVLLASAVAGVLVAAGCGPGPSSSQRDAIDELNKMQTQRQQAAKARGRSNAKPTAALVAQWPQRWCRLEIGQGLIDAQDSGAMGKPTSTSKQAQGGESDTWKSGSSEFTAYYSVDGAIEKLHARSPGLPCEARRPN